MKVDRLKLTLGRPFEVGDYYIVHPFTIEEIAEMGYEKWGYLINIFLLSWEDLKIDIDEEEKTQERLMEIIWRMYVDEESDQFFDAFNKSCKMILKRKLVKSKYDLFKDTKNTFQKVKDFFTAEVYGQMREIVKAQNLINKEQKEEHNFANEKAKKLYERIKKNRRVADKYKKRPELSDLISALRWKTNISRDEVLNLTLYELYDGLQRINIIDNVKNIKHGVYSGSLKYEDIDRKELDWMKKLEINKSKGG